MTSTSSSTESVADDAAVVREVIDACISEGTAPGAAALVIAGVGGGGTGGGGERRLVHTSGRLHKLDVPGAAAVDVATVYDLASLTKLLSTTMLVARAVDRGVLALDETPWAQRWPGVTVEHCLRHESGLPAWAPLFEEARRAPGGVVGLPAGKRIVVDAALAVAPEVPPGTRTLYSDIGIIAVGALLEERLGETLDVAFARASREMYGAACGLRFVRLDVDGFHPAVPLVAPTERCAWRRRAVQGQVHDENCFAMGGVSGHAGLFGSLLDVEHAARALQRELAAGKSTLARFAEVPDGGRRPIGFDKVNRGGSAGDAVSPTTVGHLAFTGCSLWIDGDAIYVLLTNRVHETREGPERILRMRRAFHQAAHAWVASSPSTS